MGKVSKNYKAALGKIEEGINISSKTPANW